MKIKSYQALSFLWTDVFYLKMQSNYFCSEYLLKNKIITTDLFVLNTASAGGIIAGAVLNKRPDIFKVAVFESPFLDVLNSLCDVEQEMTSSDRNEFGNPLEDEHVLCNTQAYCPYQNITKQFYPSILINHPLLDVNVGHWENLKYTTKIMI